MSDKRSDTILSELDNVLGTITTPQREQTLIEKWLASVGLTPTPNEPNWVQCPTVYQTPDPNELFVSGFAEQDDGTIAQAGYFRPRPAPPWTNQQLANHMNESIANLQDAMAEDSDGE